MRTQSTQTKEQKREKSQGAEEVEQKKVVLKQKFVQVQAENRAVSIQTDKLELVPQNEKASEEPQISQSDLAQAQYSITELENRLSEKQLAIEDLELQLAYANQKIEEMQAQNEPQLESSATDKDQE